MPGAAPIQRVERPMLSGLRRLEALLLVVQGLLAAAVVGVWGEPAAPRALLPFLLATMALLVLCRTSRPRNPWVKGFCEWGYLYPYIFASYLATGKLIPLYRHVGMTHDRWLAAVDGRLFGVTPALWKTAINHPLPVELCALGYVAYFLFGFLLVASFYRKYDTATPLFATLLSAVVLAFYISYLGYWVFPVMGPRYLWKESLDPLRGYLLADFAFNGMDRVSLGFYDAFPSEHTMFAIVAGYYWFRFNRRMFWAMAPLLVLAVAATVVLRYHWVTDVIAGATLAPAVIGIASRCGPWLAGLKTSR